MTFRPGVLGRIGRSTSFSGNIAANYFGRAWEAAMSIVFVPVYIHYLGVEAYGIIGLVAVIQSFLLILDFGLTPTLTREAARFQSGEHEALYIKDLIRSVEWVAAAAGAVIVALLAVGASAIAQRWVQPGALGQATIADALIIGGTLIALRMFESIFRGTLYGLQRQMLCNLIAAAFATLRSGGAVLVLIFLQAGLRGFFLWQVAATLAGVVAMRVGVWMALPATDRGPRFCRSTLRSVGRFAGGMVLISILSLAATQADKLLLSRMIPLEAFGYYMFAANVALVLQLVAAPLMTAVYPRIVDFVSRKDDAGMARFFHHWAAIVAVLTAPAAALFLFHGPALILAWSGDRALAANAGTILSVFAIGTFLHSQCVLPYQVQLAHGWTRLGVGLNAVALAITVPALLWAAPRFAAMAGAWTWVGIASIYFFVGLPVFFSRFLGTERWRFFVRDVGVPALTAFAVMALTSPMLRSIPDSWAGRWAVVILAFASSAVAAACVAWMVRRRA